MELKYSYLSLKLTQYSPTAASDSRFNVVCRDGASNCLWKIDSFGFDEVETADFADFAAAVEI